MHILGGTSDFFGLDMGVSAVRVVQLKGTGPTKTLDRYGQTPITGTVALSDSKADRQRIAQVIHELTTRVGISTKNVAANLPSSRVFTTVIDIDRLPPEELAKTISYQAESYIPTPLSQSKIDWAIIGNSPKDPGKIELLLSSVPNDFIERRLEILESIGLNVVAFEPDNMALVRAITSPDTAAPWLILDIGNAATDLVVVVGGMPHLARSIPMGQQAFVRAAIQGLGVDPSQAEQFVFKFGLSRDKLEGQVYDAIIGTIDGLVAEIEKSIKFFGERYRGAKLEGIVVTGGASTLPELPLYLANKFNLNVEIGNAWRNVNVPTERQNEVLAVSNHFAVAVGLAERET
ncbi:type IV pilus assembly protein PilM [Candidatus Saccharibacteria bacterium]|nr:type IV pilus assembly protein PilM [Candidatus Saccharibacteria bacterium]